MPFNSSHRLLFHLQWRSVVGKHNCKTKIQASFGGRFAKEHNCFPIIIASSIKVFYFIWKYRKKIRCESTRDGQPVDSGFLTPLQHFEITLLKINSRKHSYFCLVFQKVKSDNKSRRLLKGFEKWFAVPHLLYPRLNWGKPCFFPSFVFWGTGFTGEWFPSYIIQIV